MLLISRNFEVKGLNQRTSSNKQKKIQRKLDTDFFIDRPPTFAYARVFFSRLVPMNLHCITPGHAGSHVSRVAISHPPSTRA